MGGDRGEALGEDTVEDFLSANLSPSLLLNEIYYICIIYSDMQSFFRR
jgi:hypothetical protein